MLLAAFALAQVTAVPAPPADWSSLPLIFLTRSSTATYADTAAIEQLVRRHRECRAGVGPMPGPEQAPGARMEGLRIELIMLVAPDGRFLDIRAAPGACDRVRNYSRAIVNSRLRGRVRTPGGAAPAWYRTSLSFRWEP